MSATGLVGRAWQLLWKNPGVFNLVFWSLMLSLLTELVLQTRLAADLPAVLTHPSLLTSARLAHLKFPPGGALKLGLFFATVLLIVTPYRLAGLYGGAFQVLGKRPTVGQWLVFFRVGWTMFWRGFAATLAGIAMAVVLLLLLVGLAVASSAMGAAGSLLLIPWMVAVLFAVTLALMGLGAIMANDLAAGQAVVFALRWASRRIGFCILFGLLLIGVFAVGFFVLLTLARIPFFGAIFLLLGLWVMSGFIAVLPAALYQSSPPVQS